ncbi:MAG: DUF1501 domain-containing protein, partial [Pirellulales bacterium]
MNFHREAALPMTRRGLFRQSAGGIGAVALASLIDPGVFAETDTRRRSVGGIEGLPHFAPKARRVIYLFQSGAPSHIDLFDYKPQLKQLHGTELPDSVRRGQRVTEMTHKQKSFPCASTAFKFKQHGDCGAWISEILPHTASIADDIAIVRSVNTEAINHDPAITYINT